MHSLWAVRIYWGSKESRECASRAAGDEKPLEISSIQKLSAEQHQRSWPEVACLGCTFGGYNEIGKAHHHNHLNKFQDAQPRTKHSQLIFVKLWTNMKRSSSSLCQPESIVRQNRYVDFPKGGFRNIVTTTDICNPHLQNKQGILQL